MNQLENWIQNQIREKGPLPFRDFMYWALYHPEWGYYNRQKSPFGKEGDFYTSPGVHPVFGETLAKDLFKKWRLLGEPIPFIIMEYGAGLGLLAKEILTGLKVLASDVPIDYRIVEISTRLQEVQKHVLAGHPVTWLNSGTDLGTFTGVILSNELLDAFPVHVIQRTEQGFVEKFVSIENNHLIHIDQPLANERVLTYINDYLPEFPIGQIVEVNLDALSWLEQAGNCLSRGFLLTIDYGEEASSLYQGRPHGSLRAFREHQVSNNLLQAVGEQDLTSDVNFTSLMEYGDDLGLETLFYGTQAKYLVEAGILENLTALAGTDPFRDSALKKNLAIKQLLMPSGLGERFKVLIQQKLVG